MINIYFKAHWCKYHKPVYLYGHYPKEYYTKVYNAPVRDMMHANTPQDCAVELGRITLSANWVRQGRRTFVAGDMFDYDDTLWLYIPTEDRDDYIDFGYTVRQLDFWPQLSIVCLQEDRHE